MFSALKRNGVPLYKIAREGGWVPREQRKICIHEIEVCCIEIPYVTFRVVCSHGTYIRTLCHDIGRNLLCGAHLTGLKRLRNGAFHIDQSVSMDDFAGCDKQDFLKNHLILPKDALNGMKEIVADDMLEKKIRNGVRITIKDISSQCPQKVNIGQLIKVISLKGNLIGVVESLVNEDMCLSGNEDIKAWKTLRGFLN
jgi:tRNA pseudouridine55 synthase